MHASRFTRSLNILCLTAMIGAACPALGGATALLGRLIAKGTGEKLPDYARRVLFDPLGHAPGTTGALAATPAPG